MSMLTDSLELAINTNNFKKLHLRLRSYGDRNVSAVEKICPIATEAHCTGERLGTKDLEK